MEVTGKRQSDISRETGLPKSAISQYLSGKTEPKYKSLYKIAKAIKASPDWLSGNLQKYLGENCGVIGDLCEFSYGPGNYDVEESSHKEVMRNNSDHAELISDLNFDDFTYAMHNEGKTLTDSDKQALLAMAKQLNEARKAKDGTDH